MSQLTTRSMRCQVCGGTIEAGARVERTAAGNWARCLARGEVRHALSADCQPSVTAPSTPSTLTSPATQAPTDRQLAFAAELIRRDPGAAGGVSVASLRTQSRAQVSAWIDRMLALTEGV